MRLVCLPPPQQGVWVSRRRRMCCPAPTAACVWLYRLLEGVPTFSASEFLARS